MCCLTFSGGCGQSLFMLLGFAAGSYDDCEGFAYVDMLRACFRFVCWT